MGKKSVKRPKHDDLRYDLRRLESDRSTLDAFLDEAAQDFIQETKGQNQLPPVGGRKAANSVSTYGGFGQVKKQKPKSALLEAASQALGYSEPETDSEDDYEDAAVSAIMTAVANVSGAISDDEYEATMNGGETSSRVRCGLSPVSEDAGETVAEAPDKKYKHTPSVSLCGNPPKLRIKDKLGNCVIVPALVSGTDVLKVDSAKDAIMQWLRPFAIHTMAPHAIFETTDFVKRMTRAGIKEAYGYTFLIPQELAPGYVLCYNMTEQSSIDDWNRISDTLCSEYDDSTIAGILISAMIHLHKNRWALDMSEDLISSWMDDDNEKNQEHFMFDITHDPNTVISDGPVENFALTIMDYENATDNAVNGLADYVEVDSCDFPGDEEDDDEEMVETTPTPMDPGYYSEESVGATNDDEPFPGFDATETRRVFENPERGSDVKQTPTGASTAVSGSVSAVTQTVQEEKTEETEPGRPVPTANGVRNDSVTAKVQTEEKAEEKTEVGNQRPAIPQQNNTQKEREEEEEPMVVGVICN